MTVHGSWFMVHGARFSVLRCWVLGFMVLGAAGCAVDSVTAPVPTGPSELSVSLGLSVTPDILRQDGSSTSTILVHARDAVGQPIQGVQVRLDVLLGQTTVDHGTILSKSLTTGADGKASTMYQSPAAPPPTVENDTVITIRAMMVGSNYQNTLARTAEIRLVRPGVILPPNGAPVPAFFVSPTTAREDEWLLFDGSGSTDDGQIVEYRWSFGDGTVRDGRTQWHVYRLAGVYQVTLSVTDNRGITVTSAPRAVTITALAAPVAAFTVSPTDPRIGRTVVMNASGSTVPTGRTIDSYVWDFGDGTPQGTGQSASHVYTVAGSYTIVLTVTDSTGRKAVATRTLVVTP